MKRVITFGLICMLLIVAFPMSSFAEPIKEVSDKPCEDINVSYAERLNNNIIVEHSVTSTTRGYYSKTATHTANFYASGTLIATISIQATFHYDGNSVSVISKSVTQSDTYNGWNYSQNSFSSSGGTVTLNGTLSKLFHISQTFSMSLSCDKDGNISAS